MRIRIDCAYDGTQFHGWAAQPQLRTVQGELELALAKVTRSFTQWRQSQASLIGASGDCDAHCGQSPCRLVVAGRTDAGVHAKHQVCHCDLTEEQLARTVGNLNMTSIQALQHRLRRVVPHDIIILGVSVAPSGFDARFSALERTYVYRVCDDRSHLDPRLAKYVLRVHGQLDIDAMNQACSHMIGLHDFGSFAIPNVGGTTIRDVKAAQWYYVGQSSLLPKQSVSHGLYAQSDYEKNGHSRAKHEQAHGVQVNSAQVNDAQVNSVQSMSAHDTCAQTTCERGNNAQSSNSQAANLTSLDNGLIVFVITADAFARSMVRSLVRASIEIGLGKRSIQWFIDKLDSPRREGDTGPIAAHGLSLEHIEYPPDDQLATRAQAIKAKRVLE